MQHKLALIVTLTTSGGRTGLQNLADRASAMTWNRDVAETDGWDQTTLARFELVKDEQVVEVFEINGDAWRALEMGGDIQELVFDCQSSGLESSLRAQLDVYENHYDHKSCGHEWNDVHSCGCDDECPVCGTSISPHESVFMSGLNDEQPARYVGHQS